MQQLTDQFHLLHDDGNVVRVPFLVKGKILSAPKVSRDAIEKAFAGKDEDATYARLPDAQLLREPIIDRATMQHTGEWQYQVMPSLDPLALIERDAETLVKGLYALPFSEVMSYLDGLSEAMMAGEEIMERVRELSRRTAPHPDVFHDTAFGAFLMVLSKDVAQATVNAELSMGAIPGTRLLDGWVELAEAEVFGGMTPLMAAGLFAEDFPRGIPLDKPRVRAMPTRQLHITAGNAPAIPVFSMLRAIATKSAAVIKSPYGAVMPGALAALAAASFAPDHPITQHLSLVYWPGGDLSVEDILLAPMAFDRIVMWGAPDAVKSIQARAGFTRTLSFNPRYGLSFIGKEAFADGENLRKIAIKASLDTLIWNQKACTASFVQYVEGSLADAQRYAQELRRVLGEWDAFTPNYLSPSASGMLRRMKRGKYMNASWHTTERDGRPSSNVIVMDGKFDMLDHPMSRTVIVRRVDDLRAVIPTLHHGVASIGVFPESRRHALMDLAFAHGVSNVLPLGQVERSFGGMPHDGMRVLGDLVDWKHA